MHLTLFGPTYPFRGGISHYTTLLYHYLAQRHQVTLFSFTRQYPRFLFPGRNDRDPSSTVLRAPCQYTFDSLNPVTWLSTALQIVRTGASWVIIPWWVPVWGVHFFVVAWVVRSYGMRVLFWCHNIAPHEAGLADRHLTYLALNQGHVYVVHSPRDELLLREMFSQRLIYRTPLPILDVFASERISKDEARRHLGLDGAKPVALFFGFVRPYKGLNYLIEALAQVRLRLDVHLLVAGEFWESKEKYLSQIRCLGLDQAITLVDKYIPNEEVPIYFAAADLVVLPYLETSQSAVVQLARGFGKPVVASRIAGMMDSLPDADERLLVPPRNVEALAQAILEFFQHPKQSSTYLDDHGRVSASWQSMVHTVELAMTRYDETLH